METQMIGIDKRILFKTSDEKINNIFILDSEQFGVHSYQIKYSIKISNDTDAWYLITSLSPLKVYGGNAGTYVNTPEGIITNEFEVINFVISLKPQDFYNMASRSKTVTSFIDF